MKKEIIFLDEVQRGPLDMFICEYLANMISEALACMVRT